MKRIRAAEIEKKFPGTGRHIGANTKNLKEIVDFIERQANEEALKLFGKEKYKEYKKILNILDATSEEERSFSYIVGEINAYLG